MASSRRSASFPCPGNLSINPPSSQLPCPPPPDPNLNAYPLWQGHEPHHLFPDAAPALAPPYPAGHPPSTYANGTYPAQCSAEPPQTSQQEDVEESTTFKSRLCVLLLMILPALVFFLLMMLFGSVYLLAHRLLVILFPFVFFLLYASASYFFFSTNVFHTNSDDGGQVQPSNSGLHHKTQELQMYKTARKEAIVSSVWSRLVFLSLLSLILSLSVPVLRSKTLLGSRLWQWTLLFMLVACGYPIVSVATKVVLVVVCYNEEFKAKKNALYFARGLRRSVNLIVLSGSALLVWACHFKKATDLYPSLDKATWTLVSLFVGALLWFVKTALLLNWEADAVYRRFSERITRVGFQLYFLGLIYGHHFEKFEPCKGSQAPPQNNEEKEKDDHKGDDPHHDGVQSQEGSNNNYQQQKQEAVKQYPMASAHVPNYGANIVAQQYLAPVALYDNANAVPMMPPTSQAWGGRAYSSLEPGRCNKEREENLEKKRMAKEVLINKHRKASKKATTYDIKLKAKHFVNLYVLSSREGDGFSDLLNMFSQKIPNDLEYITKEHLMNHFEFDVEDANLLYSDELQVDDSIVSYETFKKWMLKAHKNCIVLGYTLSDAKGVVNVLNKVMTVLLIIVVTVTWLLLAQIATTNLIVLIASPFLAAAFVFGETCRRIFEGIVFSFISHPFDVGDRCIIEGTELEVKHMGVLSTTFIKIGTREEALYPNSVLATKSITNLKGDPDPDDIVELTLDPNSTNKAALDALLSKINGFLKADPRYEHESSTGIMIDGIGNSIKMTVHYGHVLSIQEVTHSQCFEKKVKQRSYLLLQIKLFLDELDIKVATS